MQVESVVFTARPLLGKNTVLYLRAISFFFFFEIAYLTKLLNTYNNPDNYKVNLHYYLIML